MGSSYILKVKPTGLANRLDVRCERKSEGTSRLGHKHLGIMVPVSTVGRLEEQESQRKSEHLNTFS